MAKLSDDVYFELPEISNSDCKALNESFLAFERKCEKETTPAMKFGSGFHSYLLENDKFFNEYAVNECTANKNTNIYKAAKAELIEANLGKEIIAIDDFSIYVEQRNSIWSHPKAMHVLSGETLIEEALFWEEEHDDATGGIVKMRGKLDIINKSINTVIDLKTCADIKKAHFDMQKMYDSQAYCYKTACEKNYGGIWDVLFIFVEKKSPFDCRFLRASPSLLAEGKRKVNKALTTFLYHTANPEAYKGGYGEIEMV